MYYNIPFKVIIENNEIIYIQIEKTVIGKLVFRKRASEDLMVLWSWQEGAGEDVSLSRAGRRRLRTFGAGFAP